MKALLIICKLFLLSIALNAQSYVIKGQVADVRSNEKMAFVNIVVNEGRFGGTTDIDGKFSITSREPVHKLKLSFVGYNSLEITPPYGTDFLSLVMEPQIHHLSEVVVHPGENPAHRIINLALKFADSNDPQKMTAYRYMAYDKLLFTVDTNRVAKISNAKNSRQDGFNLQSFLSERDLFLMETVTERSYMAPGKIHEKVLASRMSGFSDPVLVFLISQLQSTSFYDELIQVSDKNYVNPISRGSTRKYLFILQDTNVTETNDTVFTISFRPIIGTNFDGLQGVINIHSENWAIQSVQAQPHRQEKGLSISIQQLYEIIEGRWFPVQLQTDIQFNNAMIQDGNRSFPLLAIGKSYLRNIDLKPELNSSDFNDISLEINRNELQQDAAWWIGQRIDSLSARDIETYRYLDSIGRAAKLDQIAGSLLAVMKGKIPLGTVQLDLNRLFRYNDFEGFYAGLGFSTSPKLSKYFMADAYWGYGFGDKKPKYGLGLNFSSTGNSQTKLWLRYDETAEESGGTNNWTQHENPFNEKNYRRLFVNRMDYIKSIQSWIGTRALPFAEVNLGFKREIRTTSYDYFYGLAEEALAGLQQYNINEIHASLRFAYDEKFLKTDDELVSMGTRFPVLDILFIRSLRSLESDFNYSTYLINVEHTFYKTYVGQTSATIQFGVVLGDIPYPKLFNSPSAWRSFTLFAPNSFATMRMNEFISDRFVNVFLSHNFGKLLIRKSWFEPSVELHTNIAVGSLSHPELHHFVDIKTPEHGFYESGILFRNIINLSMSKIGVGLFYRYGPYGYSKPADNFGYKFTLSLGL